MGWELNSISHVVLAELDSRHASDREAADGRGVV